MPAERMTINNIRVGDQRHRHDLGDLDGLAKSIRAVGLLHPVTVDEQGNLLAGARRLAACQSLGWTDIDVRVVRAA